MVIPRLRFRLPIHLQIMMLVALTLLPGLALTVGQAFERRRADILEARERLEGAARAVAERHDRYLADVKRLMWTISGTSILDQPGAACAVRLRDAAARMPRLWSIFVADLDGNVVCRSAGNAARVNIADRGYFRSALSANGFVVGAAIVTRQDHRAVLPTAMPMLDEEGNRRGVLAATIPLSWFADDMQALHVGAGTQFELRDGAGNVLVGPTRGDAGLSPSSAADVPPKFTAVAFTAARALEVRLSAENRALEAPARSRWARQMLLIVGVAALAILLGNLYGRFTLARRAASLTGLVARLQRGEADARAPDFGPRDELSDLAVAFDRMALAVDERVAGISREVASWRHQAEHDPLTGLANRRALDARLRWECAASAAGGARACLLLIDLDRFKEVNDRHGHEAGDAVLVAVARRMRAVVRKGDLVARRGGDEFAIVLSPSPTTPLQPFAFAERLIGVLGQPYRVADRDAALGASVGIVTCPDFPIDLDQLYRAADRALYRAKAAGRGVARMGTIAVPAPGGPAPGAGLRAIGAPRLEAS